MRLARLFIAFLAIVAAASPAVADESAINKEGFWRVGRGDAEAKACFASIGGDDTPMLLIQIAPGHIDFVLLTASLMRKGKQGVLIVGDQRFDFVPEYGDKRDVMFVQDVGGRALAAMRKARRVSMIVDGRELLAVDLDGTGVEGALDATAACADGKSGWWGPGVGAPATPTQPDGGQESRLVYRKPGDIWGIVAEDGYCVANAAAPDDRFIQLLAIPGRMGLAVGSKGARLPKVGRIRVETDSYAFDLKPEYTEEATYLNSADPLDSADVLGLRRAKSLRIVAGKHALIDVDFEGDSFTQIMDDVAACAAGEKGWWREGAKKP